MKKFIFTIFLSLIFSVYSFCQSSKFDSVRWSSTLAFLPESDVINESESEAESSHINFDVEIGQGFRFQDFHHPEIYTTNIKFNSSISSPDGKIKAGASTMAIYFNGITEFFGGARISYRVYNKKNVSIFLNAEQLFGEKDRNLFGGGVNLEYGPLIISAFGHQEYKNKEFWFTGSAGVSIDKLLK